LVVTRRYAIIGTGAVGGFYGARLCRAGAEVHFLLHGDLDHVRRHGLVVDSKDGDFVLPAVHAHGEATDMPACDVVVVALKTTHNHLLPAMLPPVLAPAGVVLMMQNGLGCEEEAARVVPGHQIVGGLCFLCSTKVGPGHIRHLDYGSVRLAKFTPDGVAAGGGDGMRAVAEDLAKAGIRVDMVDDLVLARWQKLVWNIPMSGLSVALDADTRTLMGDPHTRALAEAIMHDVVAGARACRREIDGAFVQKMIDMTLAMAPYQASMKVDFDRKKPIEVEAIYGNPIRAARSNGGAMPLVEMLYRELKFLDARNRSAAAPSPP
jgi:2-dehydropantoate 2-reductase